MLVDGYRGDPTDSGRQEPWEHFWGSLDGWAVVGMPLSSGGCRSYPGLGVGVSAIRLSP